MVWSCLKNARAENTQTSYAMETSWQQKSRQTKGHAAENNPARDGMKTLDRADAKARAGTASGGDSLLTYGPPEAQRGLSN